MNDEHLQRVKTGFVKFNEWRNEDVLTHVDLRGLNWKSLDSTSSYQDPKGVKRWHVLHAFNLNSADMSGAVFEGVHISDAVFENANLSQGRFDNSYFHGCRFSNANLSNSSFKWCTFERCDFRGADIRDADFYRATISQGDFEGVRNADKCRYLTTVEVLQAVQHFDMCDRTYAARFLSWEMIRTIGNMKLFAVSMSMLGFLMVLVQCIGIYNDQVRAVHSWATTQINAGNQAERVVGETIHKNLKTVKFSRSTCWLFFGLVILSIASMLYSFGCPDEIKEFTRFQWQHALGKEVLHYWAHAWTHPLLRYACALLYAVGGAIVLIVTSWKFGLVFWYIAGYGNVAPF